ncbi:MAG: SOS response-associated peptidase [Alphaproteobacteria bacterium]|nr:SOS response-associated peptidase [Alphaproteobacteria bacterium]
MRDSVHCGAMDEAELISDRDRNYLETHLTATLRRSWTLRAALPDGVPVELARRLAGEVVESILARRFWLRRRQPPLLRPPAQYTPAVPTFEGVHDYEVATRLFWRHGRAELMAAAGATDLGDVARAHNWPEVYNLPALGQVPVVRFEPRARHRQLDLLRWGITPDWLADDDHPHRRIAVRGDYVMEDAAWRPTLRHRRCLLVVEGYYDWRTVSQLYEPHAVARADGQPLLIAGLWGAWRRGDGDWLRSAALITVTSNDTLRSIGQHRMPLIVEPRNVPIWLGESPADDYRVRLLLTNTVGNAVLRTWPVGPRVNAAEADEPACLAPLEPRAAV